MSFAPLPTLHGPARDSSEWGGKARRLHVLASAGHAVPRGFVVPGGWFQDLSRDPVGRRHFDRVAEAGAAGEWRTLVAIGAEAAAWVRTWALPRARREALAAAHGALLSGPAIAGLDDAHAPTLAVRSSAGDEDGGLWSFAGQLDSTLNLRTLESVHQALLHTWASVFAERALRYRAGLGPGIWSSPPAVAVLVQRLVVPRVSGVAFTESPVRRKAGDLWIELGPGLGEALAQGQILPDAARVERVGGAASSVVERAVAKKERALRPAEPGSGRLCTRELPLAERDRALLSDSEILRVAAAALRVEATVGGPVDVEFAVDDRGQIAILQARPITRPPEVRPSIQEIRARPPLWSQRFSGERFPEVVTPFGWSFVEPVLHRFIRWDVASKRYLHGVEPTRLLHGRPYFAVAIFRHLAFASEGGAPPQFLLEMFPPEEQADLRAAAPYLPDLPVVASILGEMVRERRWRLFQFDPRDNDARWAALEPHLRREAEALLPVVGGVAGADAGLRRAQDLLGEYLGVHLMSLLFAHLGWEALGRVLRSWGAGGANRLRDALLAEDEDSASSNPTLLANETLARLGGTIAAFAADHTPDVGSQRSPDLSGSSLEAEAWGAVLGQFGDRSTASWDLFAPRWRDDPALVRRLAVAAARRNAPVRAVDRAQAEALVRARLRRTRARRLLPWRERVFDRVLDRARAYSALRERQRFVFERLMAQARDVALALGAALVEEDRLDSPGDVRWLRMGEWVDRRADLRSLVAERAARAAADRETPHPDFMGGEGALSIERPEGGLLHGLGISGGRHTGPARVLRDPREADRIQHGDVLVLRALDPGWTPMLLTARAVVLELGSVLSHGAVVAREYGVPAVANILGATRLFQDGEILTVDGTRGFVVRHRAP